jgi:two-component system chemotaxis response regulator CheY
MATRVLVVDDAAFMRHMIKNILIGMNCEIVGEASNGEEACTMYRELRPDMVTMDLIMPGTGGLEAIKQIRGEYPDSRIVVISAIDQRQPLMEALKLGAVDYVVKPFEKDRVEEAVHRVLSAMAPTSR